MTMFSDGMLMAGGGAQAPAFISASDARAPNTINLPVPAGTSNGDLMIAFITSNVAGGSTSTPSGWTKILTSVGNNLTLEVFTKVASGEPASYAFSKSATVTGVMVTYRGGTGLVDVIGAYTYAAASAVSTGASIAPSVAGTLIGLFAARTDSLAISSGPTGMTTRKYAPAEPITMAVYDLSPSPAGASGAKTLTWVSSTATGGVLLQIY